MGFIEAFDTFRDAEQCALSFFNSCYRRCLSAGNYIYYSNNVDFELWVYVQNGVWHVIYCPSNSWNI